MKKHSRVIVLAMARKGRYFVGLTPATHVQLNTKSRIDNLTNEMRQHYLDCCYTGTDFLQSPKLNPILVRDALV